MAAQETSTMTQAQVMDFISGLASSAGLEIKFAQETAEKAKKERKPKRLPKALRPGEAEKMLSYINTKCPTGLRDFCIFTLMLRSGLRISEPLSLAVDDVDLDECYLYLRQAKGKKDRTVPMDLETIEWLRKWVAVRPESEYFFSTLKGGKLDVRQIREKCYRLSKKSGVFIRKDDGLKKVNPHILRHTCLTECLEDGMTIRDVQEIAGHENLATTSIYLSVRPERLKEKMQARGKTRNVSPQ